MFDIDKRGNTFRIRVFVGTDMNGKKIIKSTTFTQPTDTITKKLKNSLRNTPLSLNVNAKDILVSMRI